MADTNHHSSPPMPVEGDGISYSGIVWFGVVLVITAVVCQLLVWGLFEAMEWRVARSDAGRAPLAAAPETPSLDNGRWATGAQVQQAVPLLPNEPVVLREFRQKEDAVLTQYGWIDKGAQTVRVPVNRAKDLLLQRGLPVRPAPAAAAGSPLPAPDTPASAAPASAAPPHAPAAH